jgi:hypothetical protein
MYYTVVPTDRRNKFICFPRGLIVERTAAVERAFMQESNPFFCIIATVPVGIPTVVLLLL